MLKLIIPKPFAVRDATYDTLGTTYSVIGLKVGSTAVLYANGTQVSSTTVNSSGKAIWTLGAKPSSGSVMTYDGVVVGRAGTVSGTGTVSGAGTQNNLARMVLLGI